MAAAWWLRRRAPELKTRVVNVVDLMALFPPERHPHGLPEAEFAALFTREAPVVFAFHGHRAAVHDLVHGRPRAERFHVRGFIEEGTTTTPFDMTVRNRMSRHHLCIDALRFSRQPGADSLIKECEAALAAHERHVRERFEDLPEIRSWTWTGVDRS
jgi:xylulose-5-phosphate/fructose-6-phosphate phosphoketolase